MTALTRIRRVPPLHFDASAQCKKLVTGFEEYPGKLSGYWWRKEKAAC